MTKYDIRLRREGLPPARVQRFKDYQALMRRHRRALRYRGVMLLALVAIVLTLVCGVFYIVRQKNSEAPATPAGQAPAERPE